MAARTQVDNPPASGRARRKTHHQDLGPADVVPVATLASPCHGSVQWPHSPTATAAVA